MGSSRARRSTPTGPIGTASSSPAICERPSAPLLDRDEMRLIWSSVFRGTNHIDACAALSPSRGARGAGEGARAQRLWLETTGFTESIAEVHLSHRSRV